MSPGFAPPPDFRYISLEPALKRPNLTAKAGAVVCGVGVVALGSQALSPLWALGLGVGAAWLLWKSTPTRAPSDADIEHLAIVPWGVVVHSGAGPRVLRWGAIDSVQVRYVREAGEIEDIASVVRWSEVTLRARTETLVGRARGLVPLERLEAHLPSYAEEAGRPIALDAAATQTAMSDLEPVFPRLLDEVHRSVRAPDAIPELGLELRGYRGGSQGELGAEGLEVLKQWLTEDAAPLGADRRPLAAVLAAELRARPLVDALVGLITAPHPFVAAVARAAALRLGAELRRVGSLQELSDFVAATELDAMLSWGVSS